MLAGMSWLWSLYRWVATLAEQTAAASDLALRLPETFSDAARTVMPFVLVLIAAVFIWRVLVSTDISARSAAAQAATSLLFVVASASSAFLPVASTLIDVIDETTEGVTDPALETANRQLLSLTDGEQSSNASEDPLGCQAYIDELYRRADGSHPLLLTLDTWMRWSFTPYWKHANYGINSGAASDRVYCRALETGGGTTSERAEVTVCAYGAAISENETGKCETGRAALGLPEGSPGPFRSVSRLDEDNIYQQEAAWVVCREPAGSVEGVWGLNPAVEGYTLETVEQAGNSSTATLRELNSEYDFCGQWFTGDRPSDAHVCAPWTSQTGCYRPLNSVVAGFEPATEIDTGRVEVFALRPGNITNWNTHPANFAPPETLPQEWEETRSLVIVRNRGGAGVVEMASLTVAFFASLAFSPIVFGLAGGVAMSQILTTLTLAALPLLMLLGAHRKTRQSLLWPVLKLLLVFVMAEVVLTWVMIVYTLVFWAVGSISPFGFDSFAGLMWAAATPIVSTSLLVWLLRSRFARDFTGGSDLSSWKGGLVLGTGGTTESVKTAQSKVPRTLRRQMLSAQRRFKVPRRRTSVSRKKTSPALRAVKRASKQGGL